MPGFECFDKEEKMQLEEVMDTGILMRYNFDSLRKNHWKANELETAIAEKVQVQHVHLTSSGTTALITALKALGVGAEDEVILPPFTFVASYEAVLFCGAIPVFADIDDSLTLCPKSVEHKITSKTKVIMPVHMCGGMADMESIIAIARKYHLYILEDACQSTGATYRKKYLGTIGHMGCFSFDFVKTITCGEGGAVLTNDENLYQYSHAFSDHGHDHIGLDRGLENHPCVGLNFRISELHAAIGLAQWKKLGHILEKQRKLKANLKEILSNNSNIQFRKIHDEKGDNASFLTFNLPDENLARSTSQLIKESNIPCAYWYDNNWHYYKGWKHFDDLKKDKSLYEEQRSKLPHFNDLDLTKSDQIMSCTLSIPLSLKWDESITTEIAQKILAILNR